MIEKRCSLRFVVACCDILTCEAKASELGTSLLSQCERAIFMAGGGRLKACRVVIQLSCRTCRMS